MSYKKKNYTNKKKPTPKYSNKDEVKQEMSKTEDYPQKGHSSWYYRDAELMKQVTSFTFNQFLGYGGLTTSGNCQNYIVPTGMRILLAPSPGFCSSKKPGFSGINQAGLKIYTALSAGNAKTTNYAPQDVTTLMLALGEVLSMQEVARRAMGIAFTYNKRNRVYPSSAIELCGFDSADLLSNLAKYRIRFNTVINQINKIAFPANIPYFEKCVSLYRDIFVDSESPMAQSIVFLPDSTWDIDETSFPQGTVLKTRLVFAGSNTKVTMDNFLNSLESQIDLILTSATFNYIYADVLRLFGTGGLYTAPYLAEDYLVTPVYNPMILLQIDNCFINGRPDAQATDFAVGYTQDNNVYPDVNNNRLVYMPAFSVHLAEMTRLQNLADSIPVNFPHSMGDPDVDQRLESTRLTTRFKWTKVGTTDVLDDAAIPDHFVTYVIVYGNDYNNPSSQYSFTYIKEAGLTVAQIGNLVDDLCKFERAPRVYITDANEMTEFISGDLDYYTDIDFDYLSRVDDLAMVGLFDLD